MALRCALCKVQQCEKAPGSQQIPTYCPMDQAGELYRGILGESQKQYFDEGRDRQQALASARTEAAGYLRWPRVQEVMEFARRIGATHLGVASCIGLIEEARLLQKLLESNGFQGSTLFFQLCSISNL